MNTEAQVRAAKNPQEALLAIAHALDEILERDTPAPGWGQWDALPELAATLTDYRPLDESHQRAAEVLGTGIEGDPSEVILKVPSTEKQILRRLFEGQQLRLREHLGDGEDWTEAYAKGGPLWLYHGNRDLVMSYPDHVKAAMIADVDEDSHQDAHEMSRDILKAACESGPGGVAMMIGQGDIG
jgi:hypothetical protein